MKNAIDRHWTYTLEVAIGQRSGRVLILDRRKKLIIESKQK